MLKNFANDHGQRSNIFKTGSISYVENETGRARIEFELVVMVDLENPLSVSL